MKVYSLLLLLLPVVTFAQIDYNKLKGNKIDAVATYHFSNAYYYNYKINASNLKDSTYKKVSLSQVPEEMLTQKFSSIFAAKSKLIVYAKFTFEYNDLKYSIIKFRKVENNIPAKIDYFIVEFTNNQWKENVKTNTVIENFKTVLSLKDNVFSNFETTEDDNKMADINSYKVKVRDSDNIINIQKFAQVVKSNASLFSKYLDQ